MDIDDVKDEWRVRFDKEKETFAAIALKNKTRLKKTKFDLPNIMDLDEAYRMQKEEEDQ